MNISQVENENDVSGILDAHLFTNNHDVTLPASIEQKLDYLNILKSDDEKNQLLLSQCSSISLSVLSIMPALILTLINHVIPVNIFLLILSYVTAGMLGFTFLFMIFDPEFKNEKESRFTQFSWIKSLLMKKSLFRKREQNYLAYSKKLNEFFTDYLTGIQIKINVYQEMIDTLKNETPLSNQEAFITGFNNLNKAFEDLRQNPFFFNGDVISNKKNIILSIENIENLIKYQDFLLSQLQDSQNNINLTHLL